MLKSSVVISQALSSNDPRAFVRELQTAVSQIPHQLKVKNDKPIVLLVGNTGVGKSVFVNYLAKKEIVKHPKDPSSRNEVEVHQPVVPVGDGRQSCTTLPLLYDDPSLPYRIVDCPGFLDTKGLISEIVNALTICRVARSSPVQGVVLIMDKATFSASRGMSAEQSIKQTMEFLGGDLREQLSSVFLMISKVGKDELEYTKDDIKEFSKTHSFIGQLVEKNHIGLYSAVNDYEKAPMIYQRDSFLEALKTFPMIQKSRGAFNITLSDAAQNRLGVILGEFDSMLRESFHKENLVEFKDQWLLMEELAVLNVPLVKKTSEKIHAMLSDLIRSYENKKDGLPFLEGLQESIPDEALKSVIQETIVKLQDYLEKEREREILAQKVIEGEQAIDRLQAGQEELLDQVEQRERELVVVAQQQHRSEEELRAVKSDLNSVCQEANQALLQMSSQLNESQKTLVQQQQEFHQTLHAQEARFEQRIIAQERKIESQQNEMRELMAKNNRPRSPQTNMFGPGVMLVQQPCIDPLLTALFRL